MSASSVKICFNPDCKAAKSERPRKGWRLRTGEFAELCDRCGLVFEDGRFCETFHPEAAGWRSCESCRKRIHCGCIVSVHESVLLDAGGVECISCARKNVFMVPNSIRSSPFFLPLPLPDRLKNHSVKERNQIAGPDLVAGQWRQACNLWNSPGASSELHTRMPYEVDAWNGIDKMLSVDHAASSLEKKNFREPSERMMSGSLKLSASDLFRNVNAGIDMVPTPSILEEGIPDGVRHSCCLTGEDDSTDSRKVVTIESGMNTSFAGIKQENHPGSSVNVSQQTSTSKDDPPSTPHIDLAAPSGLPNQTNGQTRVSGTRSQQLTSPPLISKQNHANRHNGVEPSGEAPGRSGKSRGDARVRNQLLPRYWPKITDQELQQISGDSNSVITPLFEKILSASDAGRIGRLVLPKKCAEAYFPTISQPEGLPLKVQDAKGKEWIFQFRFWPNNNSRMYVLEGVTPCIQSMQLQAGDTVTFSRIDPEGKLVMGFRKASTVPSSDQDNQTLKTANGVSRSKEVKSAEPASIWSEVDKSGYIAKEVPKARSCLSGKRKRGTLGLKSKRLHIENGDLIELKLTWEEAQRLLRPPPDHVPNVVAIEDHEFEEYKEAPILGKPTILESNHVGELIQWVQCEYCFKWRKLPADALLPSRWTCSDNSWDPKRSSCSSAQELTAEELEDLLSCDNTVVSKKTMADKQDVDAVEAMDGLDTLANLAILGESEALPPLAQPTTKHPRHRPGCTCIVCIQPPSGKGPKHKQTCACNVCLTVKRRFQTLMSRRERRQSEKEAETARKKQQYQLTEKPEQENDVPISNTSSDSQNQKVVVNNGSDEDPRKKESTISPFKGQIDLNIQPEREDELSPMSDSGSMMKLLQDASERYLRQQQLPSSAAERDPTINQIDPAKDGLEERGSNHLDTDMDHSITLSMNNMVASTSATG